MMAHPIEILAKAIANKQPAVLATVVEVKGASPAKVGAQIVLLEDGTTAGTVGGGKLEAAIQNDAQATLANGLCQLSHYSLTEQGHDAVGTLCGGEVCVFIQPFLPAPQLIIVGGGHIGHPLKVMGEAAGFDVIVVDAEPGRADVRGLEAVYLTANSFIVLITTDHVSDEAALRQVIHSPVRYIGMIGSQHKCETMLGHLRANGIGEEALARIYAPIGLDLGEPHTRGDCCLDSRRSHRSAARWQSSSSPEHSNPIPPYHAIRIAPITITSAPGKRLFTSFSRRKINAHNRAKTELILNKAETYPTRPRLKAA
jgi:xanthine dehydrogenase accessory factor